MCNTNFSNKNHEKCGKDLVTTQICKKLKTKSETIWVTKEEHYLLCWNSINSKDIKYCYKFQKIDFRFWVKGSQKRMIYIFLTQNLTGGKNYNYQLLLKDRVWPRELQKKRKRKKERERRGDREGGREREREER